MSNIRNNAGFTILEMISAIAIIAVLSVIYLFLIDSYRERRMSEQAAKVLMLAAKVQEDYFAKEQKYFDAEVSGNGSEVYLTTPDGTKTVVRIPARVVLSLKAQNKDRRFTGSAFYSGGKIVHQYRFDNGEDDDYLTRSG